MQSKDQILLLLDRNLGLNGPIWFELSGSVENAVLDKKRRSDEEVLKYKNIISNVRGESLNE